MNNLSLLLALRFIRALPDEKSLSRLTRLLLVCVSLTSFAITLGVAILHGFQSATYVLLQNIHSDIRIEAPNRKPLAYSKIHDVLVKEFSHAIASDIPYSETYVIVQGKDRNDLSHVALLQADDPEGNEKIRALASKTIMATTHQACERGPKHRLGQNTPDTGCRARPCVLIGKLLAQSLGVETGSTITLLFADGVSRDAIKGFQEAKVQVGGIFCTGLEELDAMTLFCSHELFKTLLPSAGITAIGVTLKPGVVKKELQEKLSKRLSLSVLSWEDMYPTLAAALKLEHAVIMIILALIMLVAGSTIVAFMLFYIMYKVKTIATLLAMGIAPSTIQKSFILLGMLLTAIASGIGSIIGALASFIIDHYQLIPLPEAYFTPYLPAHISLISILGVWICAILVGAAATWWATRGMNELPLIRILKGE